MCNHATTSILAIALVIGTFEPAGRNLLAAGAETGTTSVNISLDGPHLAIELTTDAETLLARLDRLAGRGRSTSLPRERLADAVVRRQAELVRQVTVQFDDRLAQIRLDAVSAIESGGATDDTSSPRVVVRLSAAFPNGVHSIRWAYALASASYPLAIHQGASVTSETIVGADLSTPVAVVDPQGPGAGHRVWILCVPALFVALITLRIRERRTLLVRRAKLVEVMRRCDVV